MTVGMRNGKLSIDHLGKNSKFDLFDFLSQFQFYNKDISKPENINKKDFVLVHKNVIKENLVDIFGNRGIFNNRETVKFCFMSTYKINEIVQLLEMIFFYIYFENNSIFYLNSLKIDIENEEK